MSIKTTIISLLIITTISSSFLAYYAHSQKTISTLKQNNTQLTAAVEQQKQMLEAIEKKYKQQANSMSSLLTANSILSAEKEALSTKLMEHDLEELSRRKPGLVEKRINDGTKKLFDSFNAISRE